MVIGGIVLIPSLSSGGQVPPPNDFVDGLQYIDGDWTVSGYENYSNEIIVLTGNLMITNTGVLELVNVTLKMNATTASGQIHGGVQKGIGIHPP